MNSLCLALTSLLPLMLAAQTPGTDPPAVPAATAQGVLATGSPIPPATRLTAAQKAKRRALGLVEPVSLLSIAAGAGLDQWRGVPHNWPEGSEGYAIRFASAEGFNAAYDGSALILDLTFHLDPRYRRLEQGGMKARLWNALSQTFLAYKDSGGRTFNYAAVGGNIAAGFVNGTWEPPGYQSADDALVRGGLGILYHAGKNVAREFLPNILHPTQH